IRDKLVTGVQTCALPIWGHDEVGLIRAKRVKHAAGAAGRAISLGDTLVGEVGDPDRPGVSGAVRDEADLVVPPGEAQKRETRPRSEERRVGKGGKSRWHR